MAKNEPWREQEEMACLQAGVVRATPFVQTRSALGGPSVCGATRPFEMSAAAAGRVQMRPAALLRCPMVPQVDRWISTAVLPASERYLGSPVVEVHVAASYSCRPMNGIAGGKLSEHGYANALDVSAFTLADGRKITVKGGWWGSERERQFLRAVREASCSEFTTVLGPGSDPYHSDHFHLDLARHGRDGLNHICK